MNGVRIGEIIRELRGRKGISQEMLADVCGVSMQAVSKWENGQCYPDITFLPVLAEYFQVSLDYLMTGRMVESGSGLEEMDRQIIEMMASKAEEDIFYIVQYRNGEILDKRRFDSKTSAEQWESVKIRFEEGFDKLKNGLQVEIWGNANVEGDIYGSVDAGGSIDCQEINGCADAGGSIDCREINGSADAGGSIDCQDINGAVSAGGTVRCGNVNGDVSAGGYVTCSDVEGNVTAGSDVSCGNVEGNVTAGDTVTCSDVEGNVTAEDDVSCGNVGGDVSAEDTVTCFDVKGNVMAGGNVTCNDVGGTISAGGEVRKDGTVV